MKLIKLMFAISLFAISLNAKPVKVQCSDKTITYDDQALKVLKSGVIEGEIMKNQDWNGSTYVIKDNVTIQSPLDSSGFAFMTALAAKTDAQIFNFIDSLDEQTFRLVGFYTQLLQESRISDVLKYRMIKEPKLQKLVELREGVMGSFIYARFYYWDEKLQRSENLLNKYLESNVDSYWFNNEVNSITPLLVLIDFYQQQFKKPVVLNTDTLKNVFYAQTNDVQQKLLNKNLVTIS